MAEEERVSVVKRRLRVEWKTWVCQEAKLYVGTEGDGGRRKGLEQNGLRVSAGWALRSTEHQSAAGRESSVTSPWDLWQLDLKLPPSLC